MNWDTIAGNWKQFQGRVKERWGKLTDNELDQISGRRDQLVGVLQSRYGMTKEAVEDQVRAFESDCGCK
ncbi:MAG TPA: CsbD family protein [Pirellulaceae bacterium]